MALDFEGEQGHILFYNGEIVRVDSGDLRNRDAFYAILQKESGRFEFTTAVTPQEKELPAIASFMGLLMEGLQKKDEENAALD